MLKSDGPADIRGDRSDEAFSDGLYARISVLLPPPAHLGRPRTTDTRAVLEALHYWVCTGCQWRRLPSHFPPWPTVYGYYRQLADAGRWLIIRQQLERAASATMQLGEDSERGAADAVPQSWIIVCAAKDKCRRAREVSAQARLSLAVRKKATLDAAYRLQRIRSETWAQLSRTRARPMNS